MAAISGEPNRCSSENIFQLFESLMETLRKYVEEHIIRFQKQMLSQCRSAECSTCQGKKVYISAEGPMIDPPCSCGTCSHFLKEICSNHVHGLYPMLMSWRDVDVSHWAKDYWQIAKVFVDGQEFIPETIDEASLHDLLTIINRHREFAVSNKEMQQLKDLNTTRERLECAHIGEREMESILNKLNDVNLYFQERGLTSSKSVQPSKVPGDDIPSGCTPVPMSSDGVMTKRAVDAGGQKRTKTQCTSESPTTSSAGDSGIASDQMYELPIRDKPLKLLKKIDNRRHCNRQFHPRKKIGKSSTFTKLIKALQTHYRHNLRTIAPIAGKGNDVVNLSDIYVKRKLREHNSPENTQESLDEDELFRSLQITEQSGSYEMSPNRIAMEASGGQGKTVLTRMLAYKWAIQEHLTATVSNQANDVTSFRLVFFLDGRRWRRGSLYETIAEQLLDESWGRKRDTMKECIEDMQQKILIIVDGYDAMKEIPEDLMMLMLRQMLPNVCFLLTSRPGHLLRYKNKFDISMQMVDMTMQNGEELWRKLRICLGHLSSECKLSVSICNPLYLTHLYSLLYLKEVDISGCDFYISLYLHMLDRATERLGFNFSTAQRDDAMRSLGKIAVSMKKTKATVVGTALFGVIEDQTAQDELKRILPHLDFLKPKSSWENMLDGFVFTDSTFVELLSSWYLISLGNKERKSIARDIVNDLEDIISFTYGFTNVDNANYLFDLDEAVRECTLSSAKEILEEEYLVPYNIRLTSGLIFVNP